MDTVFIEGLELTARIGAWHWERHIDQRLRADVALAVDTTPAAASDALSDAISYAEVADCLRECAADADFRLLEALAEHLATRIRDRFPVAGVRLTLTKPGAVAGTRGVGVRIERGEAPRP
ncbi:dihydroneopterin aldolase [Arhodomonas sp. AD133]|uniref:dihydroneopterin aldolase n=1 Tax=Arhodomonas sp. AD133 TaxID=3415009 RepID=UPI003EB8CAFF